MAKIYIVYYSTYGHVCSMAKAVKEGIDAVEGCEAVLYQVRCLLHDPEQAQARGHPRDRHVPAGERVATRLACRLISCSVPP